MNVQRMSKKKRTIIISSAAIFFVLSSVIAYTSITHQSRVDVGNAGTKLSLAGGNDPRQVLGVQGNSTTAYPGISWLRLAYPTCGTSSLRGDELKRVVQLYHTLGIRVLLTVCQGANSATVDTQPLIDAAQGNADAVQCGNEQMKKDRSVAFLYISPPNFARFYDLCESIVHSVRPSTSVLLGSLDPHVGGVDFGPLMEQVAYLNQMQAAMNTIVHPHGDWNWHTRTLGLIDSWHNGYPTSSVNSLSGLFSFWANQFRVNMSRGDLGKHLWVVEATTCFKGCGIDPRNRYQVAVSHILGLISNAQTAMRYGIPIFYFNGKDFISAGYTWPIGIVDLNSQPKPLRQDLAMRARTLAVTCGSRRVTISMQEDLLARLYQGCKLPDNYVKILSSR